MYKISQTHRVAAIVVAMTFIPSLAHAADKAPAAAAKKPFHEGQPVPTVTIKPYVAGAVYATYNGTPMTLDIYKPTSGAVRGVIAYFFGGGWQSGSNKTIKAYVLSQLDRGYAIASIEYSLSDKAVWPVQGQEAQAAVRWLHGNVARLGLPDKIIAMGNSAGGHIAAFVAVGGYTGPKPLIDAVDTTSSSRVLGLVGWYGAYDLTGMFRGTITPKSDNPVVKLLGCHPAEGDCLAKAEAASPVTYVGPNSPPSYILQGAGDSIVHYEGSVEFASLLNQVGVPVTLELKLGFQHGDPRFDEAPARKGFEAFIDQLVATR